MASVHWSLEVRGRLRPRTVLVGEDGRELARIVRDGRVRSLRAGGATDPEGRAWRVAGPADDLRVSCGGVPRATIVDGVLEAGGQAFGWRLADDGSRRVRVTSATGAGTPLRVDADPDGGAWARITFEDDALPEPFGVVLAACVRLLEAEDALAGPGARAAGAAGPRSGERTAGATGAAGASGADPGGAPRAPTGTGAGTGDAGPRSATGARPAPAEGPPPAETWALFVEGRLRPRIVLSDGGADALATLDLRGGPPGSLGRATDRDGRRWTADIDGAVVTVTCGGRVMARAEGDELTLGGRTLPWKASLQGERTAILTGDDGRELLRVGPGPDGDGPWATATLDDELPSPLAATLASLFVLLRVDALGRRG